MNRQMVEHVQAGCAASRLAATLKERTVFLIGKRLKASSRNLQVSDSNIIMSWSVVNIHVIFMYVPAAVIVRTYGGVFATISSSCVAIFVMVGFKPFSCSCTISFSCLRIRSGKNVQSC